MRRINFQVDGHLYRRFQDIPWGQRSPLMRKMVEQACLAWETEGHIGIARLLSSDVQKLNNPLETYKDGQA